MNQYWLWFGVSPVILLLCLLFHEVGHYLKAKEYGLNPRAGFDRRGLYVEFDEATNEQRKGVLWSGLLFGYAPLFLGLLWGAVYVLLLFLVWSAGNVRELKQVLRG